MPTCDRAAPALVQDCEAAYLDSPDKLRRQFNQAFFKRLLIDDNYNVTGELAEPFETLLSEEIRQAAARRTDADLATAVDEVFRERDEQEPTRELALAGVTTCAGTPATMHTAQGLKENLMVDLMGRLSNPPAPLETLAPQGIHGDRKRREQHSKQPDHSPTSSESDGPETPGRLSNPRPTVLLNILRRLSDIEIDELASAYRAGRTLVDLAREFGSHPRTVAAHLDTRDVPRRVNRRKMSDHDVHKAVRRYHSGDSLATVALTFNVDAATVRREFRRAGVTIRPRPGWL